jgi:serine/threonine-protein kinase
VVQPVSSRSPGVYAIGALIDDRYKVNGVLGRGAHGVVYSATDEMLASKVAVKCLAADLSAEPSFKLRMHREARVMGKLSGTSATQIFAFNKAADGGLYIVMELLAGRDFETYLREIEGHGARIAIDRLVALLAPIADTLDVAHGHGIIHRDIKPQNIFVLDTMVRGGVRLLDFGLAKDMNAQSLTAEGMIAGSPGYIAPEIWKGKAGQADGRIDVYSMGIVVFRALTGKVPFDPRQPLDRLLLAVTRGERPSLRALRPELPASIDAWVQKALAILPDDRFQSVGKMWASLRSLAALPAVAPPISIDVEVPWNVEIDDEIEVEVESIRSGKLPLRR